MPSFLLILINLARFWRLDAVPAGFYIDEAAGATQIICISQMGIDLYGDHFPLFSAGGADALYTPFYIYGQILWTYFFGITPTGFRSFVAATSCLTIFFLYLWARRLGGKRFAFYVAFSASISPWAFQFSRIAWDPPVAVLFLVAGLWASSLRRYWWIAGILFAGAAYSYSPMRISAVILLALLPALRLRQKVLIFGVMLLSCIPLIMEMSKPYFLERSKFLAIWGQHGLNPYAYFTPSELLKVFYHNLLSHLNLDFLLLHGDGNLRHGIPNFGVLSWLDGLSLLALITILPILLYQRVLNKKEFLKSWQGVALIVGFIGVMANLIPASLTVNTPHALRSIGVYPFIAILTGLALYYLDEKLKSKWILTISIIIGLGFFSTYLYKYFGAYTSQSAEVFKGDGSQIFNAYSRITQEAISCKDLPRAEKPPKLFAPLRPIPKKIIDFSSNGYGVNYFGDGWHAQEPWGRWSAGSSANLIFFPPMGEPTQLVMHFQTINTSKHPITHLQVWSNEINLGSFSLNGSADNEIAVPISRDLIRKNLLVIQLRVLNPITPMAAGILGGDDRVMGIGLKDAEFR